MNPPFLSVRRLKLSHSIILLIALGVLPMVAIAIGVIMVSIEKDVNFGRWERFGIAYQRPLEALLDASQRFSCGPVSGRSAAAGDVDSALAELDRAQAEYGEALQFTEQGLSSRKREAAAPDALRREWQALRASGNPSAGAPDFTSHIRMAIAQSGDTSNLILDPDLDSYYLMDVVLCALPQTQDRIGGIVSQVSGWMAEGTVAAHEPDIAAMKALLSEADLSRIEGDVQTVLSEDANFYGKSESLQRNLPASAKAYSEAGRAFADLLGRLSANDPGVTPEVFAASGEKARAAAMECWTTSAGELDTLLETRIDAYRHKRTVSLLMIAVVVAVVAVVTWIFVRRLQKRLRAVAESLESSAVQLVDVAGQITSASQTLADSSSREASSLEETTSSLEELASMSKSNVDTAGRVTGLVRDTRIAAEKGEGDVQNLAKAMESLKASSADIAKIVRTIDEIAFQTNILALNAAVEAARAGESGAGFAVVADEVRSLAQRSAKAARETSSQIETAISQASSGAEISLKVGETLRDIVERVRRIDESAEEVSSASKEQSQGVDQINSAIAEMDGVTQRNAASAEESAAAASELGSQVAGLEGAVKTLMAVVDGGAVLRPEAPLRALPPASPASRTTPRREKTPALVGA